MTEENKTDSYVNRIAQARTVVDVDAVFDEIAALPAAESKAVTDAVEAFAVKDFSDGFKAAERAQLRMVLDVLEEVKDTPQGKMILAQLEAQEDMAEEGRSLGQVMLRLHQAKGDEAHKVVRTYAEEASKLSDEEYGTTYGLLKIVVKVEDRLAAEDKPSPTRPNPFRKGGQFNL